MNSFLLFSSSGAFLNGFFFVTTQAKAKAADMLVFNNSAIYGGEPKKIPGFSHDFLPDKHRFRAKALLSLFLDSNLKAGVSTGPSEAP